MSKNVQRTQTTKGNPAHVRMSNPRRKTRRTECWTRGQDRKARRQKAQLTSEIQNRRDRKAGKMTPWEKACARRKTIRAKRFGNVKKTGTRVAASNNGRG